MGQKICFFDIDGTLIDDVMSDVSISTKEALKKAHDLGILLFINTGRSYGVVSKYIKKLHFDGYVCGCGTSIAIHDQILMRYQIEKEQRKRIIDTINGYGYSCLYGSVDGYAFVNPLGHIEISRLCETYKKMNFVQYACTEDFPFEKFVLSRPKDEEWKDLSFLNDFQILPIKDHFIEVVPKSCSKGKAIQFVLDYLGIDKKDTYAFGDSVNDIEMLLEVEHSIVMGNAKIEVQKYATYVTEEVSKNGIVQAMKHYHLI